MTTLLQILVILSCIISTLLVFGAGFATGVYYLYNKNKTKHRKYAKKATSKTKGSN